MRVYLFALPFMSMFVAVLLAPREAEISNLRITAIFLVTMALVGSFLLLRYGNERGSYFPSVEIKAVNRLYDVATPQSLLMAVSPSVPWQFRHYEYKHETLTNWEGWRKLTRRPPIASVLIKVLRQEIVRQDKANVLLIVTPTQDAFGEMLGLSPRNWIMLMETALSRSRQVHTVFEEGSTAVFRVER